MPIQRTTQHVLRKPVLYVIKGIDEVHIAVALTTIARQQLVLAKYALSCISDRWFWTDFGQQKACAYQSLFP